MEEKNNSEQQKNNFVEDVIGYTPLSYSGKSSSTFLFIYYDFITNDFKFL